MATCWETVFAKYDTRPFNCSKKNNVVSFSVRVIFFRGGEVFFYQRNIDLFLTVMKFKDMNHFQIWPNWFTFLAQVNDKNFFFFFRADLTMPQSLKIFWRISTCFFEKKQQRVQFTEEKKKDSIGTKTQHGLSKFVLHKWSPDHAEQTWHIIEYRGRTF